MIDRETLQKFCGDPDWEPRTAIHQPWTRDGYTYATNGHIIVRVPAIADVPENPKAPDAAKLFAEADMSLPLIEIPDLVEGEGRKKCPDCKGTGNVVGDELCRMCEGDGMIGIPVQQKIGAQTFDRDYLAMIKALPWARISLRTLPYDRHKVTYFTFDGGDGLLMPMRVD